MATVIPTFQPQNPAISGYSLGWKSCQAYSAAMAGSFDRQVKKATTGEAVRRRTGDTVGGLTLAQVDAALNSLINVNLRVVYRMQFDEMARLIDKGMGASLSLWYGPIADSRFDAGKGFRGNHQVFIPPGWAAMDPLADGRPGAYRYRNEPYPRSLLKEAAGKLNLSATGYRPLGTGLVYVGLTRDVEFTYRVNFDGGEAFWVYEVESGIIKGRYAKKFTRDTWSPCSPPRRYDWPGVGSRTLVTITNPKSSLFGKHVQVPQGAAHLQVVP